MAVVQNAITLADEAHITQNWETLGINGDDWVFEKIIYSTPYGDRAVHLFARVDENGFLQEVSVFFLGSDKLRLRFPTSEQWSRS